MDQINEHDFSSHANQHDQREKVAQFFNENGITFFYELSCEECRMSASACATVSFDMEYNTQQIFDIKPAGFICERCGKPYKVSGVKMWTNHPDCEPIQKE